MEHITIDGTETWTPYSQETLFLEILETCSCGYQMIYSVAKLTNNHKNQVYVQISERACLTISLTQFKEYVKE